MRDPAASTPDVVVVGAGTAGAVLAAGLARRGARVLVLERGPRGGSPLPAWSLAGAWDPARSHGDTVQLRLGGEALGRDPLDRHPGASPRPARRTLTMHTVETRRGATLGGSSAVNGTYFLRATASDHARLATASGATLDHDRLTAAHAALERDAQLGAPAGHGDRGPVTVGRDDTLEPVSVAAAEAFRRDGLTWSDDLNDPATPATGSAGSVVTNSDGLRRFDTGSAFLARTEHVGSLEVRSDVRVRRVVVGGTRVSGVECASTDGRVSRVDAPLVVLAAGAVGTAELLLASGIGPPEQLSSVGIDPVADLPVGAASWQHPVIDLHFRPRPGAVAQTPRSFLQVAAHLDARGSGDVVEVLATRRPYGVATGLDPTDDLLSLRVTLMSPRGRGTLHLDPADATPVLTHDVDPDDLEALAVAARRVTTWATDGPLASWVDSWHGPDIATCGDAALLEAWVGEHVTLAFHLSGTAPMGPGGTSDAVVDGGFRVHGVEGLAVVDTSVLPTPLSRGPAATAVALGAIAAEELG